MTGGPSRPTNGGIGAMWSESVQASSRLGAAGRRWLEPPSLRPAMLRLPGVGRWTVDAAALSAVGVEDSLLTAWRILAGLDGLRVGSLATDGAGAGASSVPACGWLPCCWPSHERGWKYGECGDPTLPTLPTLLLATL